MRAYEASLLPVIAIVGATASGKSSLADHLARDYNSAVLSADSMQIYRGLDIGTAKTPVAERSVPYYGIDIVDLTQPYSAAEYQSYARKVIDRCHLQSRIPVVCGGTGLYLRAALDKMEFPSGSQTDNPIRQHWQRFLDEHGEEALHNELYKRDPQSAEILDPHNHKRVIRAFEMLESGVSYYDQKVQFDNRVAYFPTCYIGINVAKDELNARIDRRVDLMIQEGLVKETQQLMDRGLAQTYTARHAIAYKELFRFLSDECSFDDAVADIKRHSRQYAKRQRTWFRADERIQWIDGSGRDTDALASEANALIKTFIESRVRR
jgi:tRNA dimethylallyltransferase